MTWAGPDRVVNRQVDGVTRANIQENVRNHVKNDLTVNIQRNQKNVVLKHGNYKYIF